MDFTVITEPKKYFLIDFDSTITKVEGLDELAAIALKSDPEGESKVARIKELTDKGMAGELSFSESLTQRLALLKANKSHVDILIEFLKENITDSFDRNRAFLKEFADQILIISSGFKDFIVPIAKHLGLKPENVYANTFIYNETGDIVGVDQSNPLSKTGGKIEVVKFLNLDGHVSVIGDGFTDFEIKKHGLAQRFYAFIENVERSSVTSVADFVIKSLDEFLFYNQLPRGYSYPKSMIKVLLLENVHPAAKAAFEEQGFNVEFLKGALDEDELCEKIKDVSIIGIRSKTQITKRVLEHAEKLLAIGAFCIGTNQIDLKEAEKRGICVFNAPYSNTRSVVELVIGEMIMLIRKVFVKSTGMHQGKWDKSAVNSFEVRGKKLGMIGYGHIGTQLSVLGEALGMEVYFYDIADKMPIGNAKKCRSMEDVFRVADIVSLHIDGRESNTHLIGEKEFNQMKDGVIFLNLSRGHVVDIPALVQALKSGKVGGAGVDVFPHEPKTNHEPFKSELMGLENVILTPHIGGSTEEAQEGIGNYVPERLLEYINNGSTTGTVNFPELSLPLLHDSHRLLHIHKNVPGILAKLNNIFAKHHINIRGQYLKTSAEIGYVIVDIEKSYSREFVQDLKSIEETIRFRMLF
ncbi:D-isomer specific 2-hydroxyacid dehydrogenase NAD-binding protein [Leadbetterella byssophila DSM 17132]|uniref:D-3-phosphoglycerate dehydrogenase n=1 Tax=Leadbetterella byssophila (strain DSM 17132 / JCM 16389 / KACC 11308 / NBRC 106382 / 4M15) TaxID=649349 RepID=E4RUD1_LEAB4|nr:D-isomer specific 2-hydroxyacid dehydrogenase NAD-binding protein [Leadbetterella byssophila DSM 17132]